MACNVASVAARLLDQLRMRSWIEHWCGICWRQSLEAHSVISASSQSAAMRVLAAILPLLAIAYCQPSPPSNLPPDLNTETEVEARAQVPATDFIFPFTQVDQSSTAGNLRGFFINNDAALATLPGEGASQNLVTIEGCGVNQPHVHPRGTEISFVTQGQLFFGFIEENASKDKSVGGRFISGNVTQGQTVVVPQGLPHFAQNLGCSQAQFIATFPTRDPGTVTLFSNLFSKLPTFTIRGTTGLDDFSIANIQGVIARQVNPSFDSACLARCSMPPVSAPALAANYSQAPGVLDGFKKL